MKEKKKSIGTKSLKQFILNSKKVLNRTLEVILQTEERNKHIHVTLERNYLKL